METGTRPSGARAGAAAPRRHGEVLAALAGGRRCGAVRRVRRGRVSVLTVAAVLARPGGFDGGSAVLDS